MTDGDKEMIRYAQFLVVVWVIGVHSCVIRTEAHDTEVRIQQALQCVVTNRVPIAVVDTGAFTMSRRTYCGQHVVRRKP